MGSDRRGESTMRADMNRGTLLGRGGAALVVGAVTFVLGNGHFGRVSSPEGFRRIPVDDAPRAPGPHPRHAVLAVVDGLADADAQALSTVRALRASWPCLRTDVGTISLSRPGYAVLSTGLESDRNGCRSNADARPIAAQSLWEVAREQGREVDAASSVGWWKELFPRGFDGYRVGESPDDLYASALLGDVALIHSGYLDDAAHEHGIDSAPFAAAMARIDRELGELVGRLDLRRDVLVVTADHGHVLRGGHGGRGPRESFTRTCFAGAGVLPGARDAEASATIVAPTLAMLAGLPFPRDARASADGDDDLDLALSLLDPAQLGRAWLDDRRAQIGRMRAANPRWADVYAEGWRRQHLGLAAALGLAALTVVALVRRGPQLGFTLAWLVATLAAAVGVLRAMHGRLDLSAIRYATGDWVRPSLAATTLVGVLAIGTHLAVRRDLDVLSRDLLALSLFGGVLSAAYPLVFGWHLGFPLPDARLVFLPVLLGIVVLPLAALATLVSLLGAWRAR